MAKFGLCFVAILCIFFFTSSAFAKKASKVNNVAVAPESQLVDTCEICDYVMNFTEVWLNSNVGFTEVEKVLDLACYVIPESYRAGCESFIAGNLPALIQLIESKEDAATVCAQVHACSELTNEMRATHSNKFQSLPKRQASHPAVRPDSPQYYDYNCQQMCSIVQNTGMTDAYGLIETMICVSWLESTWDCGAENSYSGAAGLWQFLPQYWTGQGSCPTYEQGFFNCQDNANCMFWAITSSGQGLNPWADEPQACAECVWKGECDGNVTRLQYYPGCSC